MGFDFNKYDESVFHSNNEVNLKIKALLLWFDHQCYVNNLNTEQMITLLDDLIKLSVKEQWFEVSSFFTKKRNALINLN